MVPFRYVVAAILAFDALIIAVFQFNINIALVSMVNYTEPATNASFTFDQCPDIHVNHSENHTRVSTDQGEFNWSTEKQGQILAAYYYGIIISQLPSGILADKYGGKILLCLSLFLSSICSLLTPVVARFRVDLLIFLQTFLGFVSGPIVPSYFVILSKWSPTSEVSIMLSIASAGAIIGSGMQLLTGLLCSGTFLGGWPAPFYIFGAFGALMTIITIFFLTEKPSESKFIVSQEKIYIEKYCSIRSEKMDMVKSVPIKEILTSVPVWSLILNSLFENYPNYVLGVTMPLYFSQVLKMNVFENSIVLSIPSYLSIIIPVIAGLFADYLRHKNVSTGLVRKSFTFVGDSIFMLSSLLIALFICDKIPVIYFYVVLCSFGVVTFVGAGYNPMDIAPQYSGFISSLVYIFSNLGGLLAPLIVTAIVKHQADMNRWKIVFYSSAASYFLAALIFVVFGSGKVQPWARTETEEANDSETKALSSDHEPQSVMT